jgi:hypothetical protein
MNKFEDLDFESLSLHKISKLPANLLMDNVEKSNALKFNPEDA